jgi:hypothetical protein
MTVFLAALPLAIFGGATLSGFACVMLFGIVVGTSSSIFIAAPILLFLGENRLRRDAQAPVSPKLRPGRPSAPAPLAAGAAPPAAKAAGKATAGTPKTAR